MPRFFFQASILKILHQKEKATVREVFDTLGKEGSYTTIMTVMSRLAEKGVLQREKVGKQFLYWPVDKKAQKSMPFFNRLLDRFFHGKKSDMVSYLLDAGDEISDEELSEIEALIQKKRQEQN